MAIIKSIPPDRLSSLSWLHALPFYSECFGLPRNHTRGALRSWRMISSIAFLAVVTAFLLCVWYAATHEDMAGTPRLKRLTQVFRRLRQCRSSQRGAAWGRGEASVAEQQCAEQSSARKG